MRRVIVFLFLFLSFLLPVGCNSGSRPDGLPKLYPVTLRLEQDGKPLAGATVILSSEIKWSCGGISDDNGVVQVRTHGQFSGAPLGRYKVAVSKIKSSGTAVDVSGTKSFTEMRELEAQAVKEQQTTGDFGSTTYFVERQFSSPATTPLEIEVVAGKNDFKLDCGSAVEIVEKRKTPFGH